MAGIVASGDNAAPWPELREELRLFSGPAGLGGEPSWTLYDPTAQRFFQLGWLEVEILNRWRLGASEVIAASIAKETTLQPHPALVDAVKKFFTTNDLTTSSLPEDTNRLAERRRKKQSLILAAMKNYLFIRIPLVKPDAFLTRTAASVAWIFSRRFAFFLFFGALLGFYIVGRQWSEFKDTFASLISFEGGVMAMAAMSVSKVFHELGHAYAAKTLGLRVPSMGLSLMCFAPVLWTDTTEAWKLRDRRERLLIGGAGVYAELSLAVLAALAWPLLPSGALKTAAFLTASSTWILTLAVNINPCMRYDGYYLLSDYWNVPGLQTRSFALAKWRLREWLFGLNAPPPEILSPWDCFKLTAYAFATWIYRFFLFLGIALLVYHLFFKALGIVLMLVELVFFIALPVCKEIMHWTTLRKQLTLNLSLVRSVTLLALGLLFFAFPWHAKVDGPGMLFAERQAFLFAPSGAKIAERRAVNGAQVDEGRLLFHLRSPDLEAQIGLARRKVATQRLKLSFASLDTALRAEMASDWEELERLAEDLGGLLTQREELIINAPFSGVVNDVPAWIQNGLWVADKESLGVLTGGGSLVSVYVSEADWSRVRAGNKGKFYAMGPGWTPTPLTVVMVDARAATEVTHPELASIHGGPLPVHSDAQGKLVPEQAIYRVLCRIDDPNVRNRFLVGRATLEAAPRSLLAVVWNNFVGLLVRESGW